MCIFLSNHLIRESWKNYNYINTCELVLFAHTQISSLLPYSNGWNVLKLRTRMSPQGYKLLYFRIKGHSTGLHYVKSLIIYSKKKIKF
jgi:hypothetical protein